MNNPEKDRKIRKFQQEIESAFSEIIHVPWGREIRLDWVPPIDVYENEDALVIIADLPGIDPARITTQIHRNNLVLCGERTYSKLTGNAGRFVITERVTGKFCRTIQLPSPVESQEIQSEYEGGILKLTLPKKKKKQEWGL